MSRDFNLWINDQVYFFDRKGRQVHGRVVDSCPGSGNLSIEVRSEVNGELYVVRYPENKCYSTEKETLASMVDGMKGL